MTGAARATPVGSDFATAGPPTRTTSTTDPPWADAGRTVRYVETGRQALLLVRRHAEARGLRTVLVPEYLCASMVSPFRGWEVVPYRLDVHLGPDLDHLASTARRAGSRVAVLLPTYFGLHPPPGFAAAVAHLRGAGGMVILDETHSLLDPGRAQADVRFASLRKVLPLGDGAYVQADDPVALDDVSTPSDSIRWDVMDDMAHDGAGSGRDEVRQRMASANLRFEQAEVVRGATPRTLTELRHLDYALIRARRRANAHALAGTLDGSRGIDVVNPPERCDTPSHLVLSVQDPRELQVRLAARSIFCPIHWPEVDLGPERRPWRQDLISIPIDQRYGPEDMARVGAELQREARR